MRSGSWVLSLLVLSGCVGETDPDVRWKSMTGVFGEVWSKKKLCLCTRGDALEQGRTDWYVSCSDEDLSEVALLWQDSFPGPNRRLIGQLGAVALRHDTDKLLVPTTFGSSLLEYSSRVSPPPGKHYSPQRRLFIDTLVLTVDPICQDRTGGACERESRLEGFEMWCSDSSVLVEEP